MTQQTQTPATRLVPAAQSAFNWLLWGGLALLGVSLLVVVLCFGTGDPGGLVFAAVLLLTCTPLLAAAGIVAGLGKRTE
ncbi:hypothetical protein FB468_2051 [Leucobacter komagatae]|uniref:Uncharacterized protein n=1 Tax=Leucobacter komagatae TaxID=55969 RepID=A0A542Y7D7_9MICO|nr:hypothetical protein [Leucobacter komagatae]TQL44013.1 hypothetical protein FB468_2051 [Leucobacter komagatae]